MSNSAHETSIPSETDSASARKTRGRFSLIDWVAVTSGTHTRWYLAAIVLLAALARIPFLGTIPNGFHNDEAIIGYDAYCILHTGADHYGDFLPVFARSNNVYNEALHRYFAAISIWIFGLNVAAVRLPMAIVGVLTVLMVYHFAMEFFQDKRTALLVAFLLAVNPWHVTLTRVSFRAMLLPLFVIIGLWCVLRARKKPDYYVWAGLFFGVSLYTYHGARGFVPFLVIGLVAVFWPNVRRDWKQFAIGAAIFVAILAFLASYWLSPIGMEHQSNLLRGGLSTWIGNYWYNLSPGFLFVLGNQHGTWSQMILAPGLTPMQYFEVVTLPIGAILMIRSWKAEYWLFVLWLAIYPIATSLSYQGAGYLLRLTTGPLLFTLISGFGLFRTLRRLRTTRRTWAISTVVLVIVASVATSTYFYFVYQPKHVQKEWQYGVAEAFDVAQVDTSSRVYVSAGIWSAYMHTLFHTGYPPRDAQTIMRSLPLPKSGYLVRITDLTFGRYRICSEDRVLAESASDSGSLAIVTPDDFVPDLKNDFQIIRRVDYNNGEPAYYVLRSMGSLLENSSLPVLRQSMLDQ